MTASCLACPAPRAPWQYLCRHCRSALKPDTRRALKRWDALAVRRLSDLREQLREGVPLHLIEVTA